MCGLELNVSALLSLWTKQLAWRFSSRAVFSPAFLPVCLDFLWATFRPAAEASVQKPKARRRFNKQTFFLHLPVTQDFIASVMTEQMCPSGSELRWYFIEFFNSFLFLVSFTSWCVFHRNVVRVLQLWHFHSLLFSLFLHLYSVSHTGWYYLCPHHLLTTRRITTTNLSCLRHFQSTKNQLAPVVQIYRRDVSNYGLLCSLGQIILERWLIY